VFFFIQLSLETLHFIREEVQGLELE